MDKKGVDDASEKFLKFSGKKNLEKLEAEKHDEELSGKPLESGGRKIELAAKIKPKRKMAKKPKKPKAPKAERPAEKKEVPRKKEKPEEAKEVPEEPGVKEEKKAEATSYTKYLVFGAALVVLLAAAYLFFQNIGPYTPGGNNHTFPMLEDGVRVCDEYYLCFLENGTWKKPPYNAGANLTIANAISVQNESEISGFFKREKINLVFGSSEEAGQDNAGMILSATPFTYYLSYYYSYKQENKTITGFLLSNYTSEEPAVIVLGPELGATETSLKYDGKNVVVQAQSFDHLSLLLGKLLILAVKR